MYCLEKLRVAGDHRHLETVSGKPFFWLADTDWTVPMRLKWDDVQYLMDKRVQQGFTVLQIVALDPEMDPGMHTPCGEPALIGGNLLKPNEAYFKYLDWIIDEADKKGLYILLLPAWGQLVVGEDWSGRTYEKTVTEENAWAYGDWIGNRYKDRTNIVWCLGGDRQPIHKGVSYKNVWRRMAEGIGHGVTGLDLKWNVPDAHWSDALMTYHTCFEMETGKYSTMTYWDDHEAWIDFIMLQSGHGAGTQNYLQVKEEYDRARTMPVFDGEPTYEQMPSSWPDPLPLHDEWIVRKRAYWSLFAGAFGHTYGHSSVWCTISEKERSKGRPYTWCEALDRPGAWQMRVLRDFVSTRPLEPMVPCQDMIGHGADCGEGCLDDHRQACVHKDGKCALVYLSSGGTETVNLCELSGDKLHVWWFNPRNGVCTERKVMDNPHTWMPFTSPDAGKAKDWVLVIDDAQAGYGRPGRPLSEVRALFKTPEAVEDKVFPGWEDDAHS